MDIVVNVSDIAPHNRLRWLFLGLFKQVWSQSVDHDLEVQCLIVQFFIELSVSLMRRFLRLVDALESF